MKKIELLKKVRKGDENIGKLIVFAVTIIIAVGVLGTLAYFYNQSRENAVMESLITSTSTKAEDLASKGLCTSGGYITYSALDNKYTLHCSGTVDCNVLKGIGGVADVNCTSTGATYKMASTSN